MALQAADSDSLARAEPYHRRALAIRSALAREDTTDYFVRNDVARTYGNLGGVIRVLGRPNEAIAALDSAAAIGERLVLLPLDEVPPADEFTRRGDLWSNVREDLARIYELRGDVIREAGDLERAIAAWERSHQLREELVAKYPESIDYRNALGYSKRTGGMFRRMQQRYDESMTLLTEAERTLDAVASANPDVPLYRTNVCYTQLEMIWTLNAMNRKREALAMADRALASVEQAITLEPTTTRKTLRAEILNAKADHLLMDGRPREALPAYQAARTSAEEALGAEPESIYHRSTLIRTVTGIGRASARSGDRERALTALREALELNEPLASRYPSEAYQRACIYALMVPVSAPVERDSLGGAAVNSLREAITRGEEDHAHMRTDTDLDAIRDRADFKALMAGATK
jgi:tetratricopeptide (TPR) repeat protein